MHAAVSLGILSLLFSLSSPATAAAEIGVDISGTQVTLHCPLSNGMWKRGKEKFPSSWEISNYSASYDGPQVCTNETNDVNIYLKIRVCEGCVELSFGLVAGIITADLLFTFGVLYLVYYCTRNRVATFAGGAAKGGPRGRPKGQNADHPPPVPNPDYEPIRKGQREVYAGLQPRAF